MRLNEADRGAGGWVASPARSRIPAARDVYANGRWPVLPPRPHRATVVFRRVHRYIVWERSVMPRSYP